MKKILNSFFVIIVAMVAFSGCVKDEPAVSGETNTVEFIAESIDTKSAFGVPSGLDYPTYWTENDTEVKVLLNLNEETGAEVKVSADFKSMSFSADIKLDDKNPSSSPYQFAVISPSKVYLGKTSERFAVTIPTTQTPLVNSVDESAQILYAVSDSYDEMPSRVNLTFKHFTAYGKLSFTNLNLGDAKVNSVAITSSVPFANRWNYFVGDDKFEVNSGSSTITLDTKETENLCFACAPVGSLNGQSLTFTINTDKGPLTKTVDFKEDKYGFNAGRISKMTVDMSGVEFAKSNVYELVTDADELTLESKIISVAPGFNQALSTTQNGNNRAQASVTKSSDNSTITDPGNDVQVLVVGEGSIDGTISLATGDNKYLYAPGGGNYLRETSTLNENASWKVSVTESGVATIKANRSDRNWLRYNSTNNPPIFSCYTSGQADVSIYKLQGTGSTPLPKLAAPTVTVTLNDEKTGVNVTWNNVPSATKYVISGVKEDITTTETSCSFESLEPGTYTISVKATAEGYKSATGSASITVPAAEIGDGGEESVEYTLLFGANYNSKKISSYTDTWTATNNGFTCTLANWNNNNNGWSYVKAGRKNYASVATITTVAAVPEALTTVTLTVDAVTSSKINSLKLYVSSDANFTTKDTYTATAAKGNVVFSISKPVANAYYKIEVDCASGSSNGLITVSKVVYAN